MTIMGNIFSYAAAPFSGATPTQDGTPGLVPTPFSGQEGLFLRGDGSWAAAGGGGGGDVNGPVSSTDNAIVRFDGAGGKTIQNSVVTISDSGDILGAPSITRDNGNLTIATTTAGNVVISPIGNAVIKGLTYPSTDGTAGQFLTTNGSGTLSFANIPGLQNIIFVSKNGNDATGNGSLTKPYLTIAAANAAVTGASTANRFLIYIFSGTYAETALKAKAWTYYHGQGHSTRITSTTNAWELDLTDTNWGGSARGAIRDITLSGSTGVSFDFTGFAPSSAVIDILDCTANGGLTLLGRSVGADTLQMYNSYFLGAINITNFQGFARNSFGTSTFAFTASLASVQMDIQCFNFGNTTVTSSGGFTATMNVGASEMAGTLTLNGAQTVVDMDAVSFPSLASSVTVNAGTLTKRTEGYSVRYDPATPANWLVVPNDVSEALDTLAAKPSFTWNDATADGSLAAQNGYITNKGASQLVYTLPLTAALGATFEVVGKSANGWRINQNASQAIYLGSTTTTTGIAGYAQASAAGDSVRIVCITADTEFRIVSSQGQIELL